jgi:hypothetical protein
MFYGLIEDFIHYCTWSWDEVQHLLQHFKILRALMIVHHNCIYIKSIVIFSFMKLAIKLFDSHNMLPSILSFCVQYHNTLTISQIFINHVVSTHFNSFKNEIIFLPLDILNIGCTKDYEMHLFILFYLQALT